MPNPAGFFLVARVGAGRLQYLCHLGSGKCGQWLPDDSLAHQFVSRANARSAAALHSGAGVVVRSFQAAKVSKRRVPPQAQPRGVRGRAALPPSTNRGGKSKEKGTTV